MVTDEIKNGTILRRLSKKSIDFNSLSKIGIPKSWVENNKEFIVINHLFSAVTLSANGLSYVFIDHHINENFKVKQYDDTVHSLFIGSVIDIPKTKSIGKQMHEYNDAVALRAERNLQSFLYVVALGKNKVLLNDHMPEDGKMTGDWYSYKDINLSYEDEDISLRNQIDNKEPAPTHCSSHDPQHVYTYPHSFVDTNKYNNNVNCQKINKINKKHLLIMI
jgi:hypothetical protein